MSEIFAKLRRTCENTLNDMSEVPAIFSHYKCQVVLFYVVLKYVVYAWYSDLLKKVDKFYHIKTDNKIFKTKKTVRVGWIGPVNKNS